jgi:hypothetical protein
VLAMAGYAGFYAELSARLGKSRLKESRHRVGILIAGVTSGALLVTDRGVAKYGIGGAESKPELNFGLELLAHGSGRILLAVAARHAQYWADLWHGNARLPVSPLWLRWSPRRRYRPPHKQRP